MRCSISSTDDETGITMSISMSASNVENDGEPGVVAITVLMLVCLSTFLVAGVMSMFGL